MPKTHRAHIKKRNGLHHRQGPRYLKTYLPYLPLVISIALSLVVSSWKPAQHGTLAYATEMSISTLLSATNTQRVNNGQAALQNNQQLNSAAQTKANDMIARNYWSHNTPDGQEPWVFFDNAGYKYQKAGENLAYGFATSSDTVAGWMNSASHRSNLLDGTFTEVGFGFANGNSYNNSGQQTVVVAHYGRPQTLGASVPAPVSPEPSAPASTPAPAPAAQAQPSAPNSTAAEPAAPNEKPSAAPTAPSKPQTPTNTDFPVIGATGLQPITKAQTITAGYTPWVTYALGLLSGAAVILLLFKHTLALRHVLVRSEKMLLKHFHHPWLDSIGLGVIILAVALSRTAGYII